jgi:RNA polymerase sigma factor (sigma-70 family)
MAASNNQLAALLACVAEEGDRDACEAVIERSMDRLMFLARRMLGAYPHLRRWETSDDILQESAIRLCRSLRELKPRSVGQLFGLATVETRRALIDLARHHFGPMGEAAHHDSDVIPRSGGRQRFELIAAADRSSEPQSIAEWTAFHEAVDALPHQEREVFDFIWYGGATYGEVAEILEISRRTVIRRMNRARLKLADDVVGVAER